MPAIDKHGQKNDWMSVPQFGGWDQKAGGATDYSMVFSRARANKKQQKTEVTALGNEREYLGHPRARNHGHHAHHHAHQAHAHVHHAHVHHAHVHHAHVHHAHVHSPMKRKRFLSYFSCCGSGY
ncbi:hypothetical protein H6P81_007827 [Aristolochia fimbriata]|uniref:RIN4 pathogenic type III effector avirulence factor Avr cleavage site domain-containing protein n=1 Tax=Aristolochia fimbriata TaxID=158543 RepID=A0AAV7F5U7_ARIFI|nr:hypothetical protein H6P81_007827 [Aristolochia fimbriata]